MRYSWKLMVAAHLASSACEVGSHFRDMGRAREVSERSVPPDDKGWRPRWGVSKQG